MRLLLTGSSGFLSGYIIREFANEDLYTLSRKNNINHKNHIKVDLSTGSFSLPVFDVVIHAAGKAHVVPVSQEEAQDFFKVNVSGTRNLLLSLEKNTILPHTFIFISSVAVYGLYEGIDISEDAPLLATDPYGSSKIEAENIIIDWCRKNKVRPVILRLPLLVGSNPPGNLGAMMNGIRKGFYFGIKDNKARKSIVLAKDVASIIRKTIEVGGIFNLTDRVNITFPELELLIAKQLNKKAPLQIPLSIATLFANVGNILGSSAPINTNRLRKITSTLTFDSGKAHQELSWNPAPVNKNFIL
jgi:nucleoside-diphosphate-sugar epimerase